jgi:hypothetical protein
MSRLVASIGLFLVLICAANVWPGTASADDATNITTYRKYLDSVNKGDVAAVLALFADNAQVSAPPTCAPAPCTTRAAIQNFEQSAASDHVQVQLLSSVNIVNGNVTALVAVRSDTIRALGLSRIVLTDTVTFSGDRISKFVVEPQASDPQTAVLLRILSQPAPAPSPPSTSAACPPNPSPTNPADPSMIVNAPLAGQRVTSPMPISGRARVFEAAVSIDVFDASGGLLVHTFTMASGGAPALAPFAASVPFAVTREQTGCIRVFEASARDGSPVNVVQVPITLGFAIAPPNTGDGGLSTTKARALGPSAVVDR